MLNLGNSTVEESSVIAVKALITVSWLSDMTQAQTTSSRTLGENLGENLDTSLWLLVTLAVWPMLLHTQLRDLIFD